MNDATKSLVPELIETISTTWKGALISAGMSCGIFDTIGSDEPVTLEKIATKLKIDEQKLDHFLYCMILNNFITCTDGAYSLTEKGKLLTSTSEVKDVTGMLQLTEFYLNAAVHAKETFKTNSSLDKISDGKVTRDYQPKVSDNFSITLVDILNRFNVGANDTLLDVGCGSGSFLRMISTKIPELKLTGMEANLFVIERGKKMNIDIGVSERINLLVGDITEDLTDVPSNSYDWITAINVFHFIPENKRIELMENMVRIARKGVFATETVIEASPIVSSGDGLMFLLWNDFEGFFRKSNLEIFNQKLAEKYKNYKFEIIEIMHGINNLLTIVKD